MNVNKLLKKASSTIKPTFKAWEQVFDFSKIPKSQGHNDNRNKTNSNGGRGGREGSEFVGPNESRSDIRKKQ